MTVAGKGVAQTYLREVVLAYDGDDCLIWPFGRDKDGYARTTHEGRGLPASRLVCIKSKGPPPSAAHQAAHSCGNGHLGCVNKRHVDWKTPLENSSDKNIHGTMVRGEKARQAKLSNADASRIKSLKGLCPQKILADRYGVAVTTISHIQTGYNWKHIGDRDNG